MGRDGTPAREISFVSFMAYGSKVSDSALSIGGLQLLKPGRVVPNTRDFNTPLSKMDRSSKQNINNDIVALNNSLGQMDLTVIYIKTVIPKKQSTHSFQMNTENFQR